MFVMVESSWLRDNSFVTRKNKTFNKISAVDHFLGGAYKSTFKEYYSDTKPSTWPYKHNTNCQKGTQFTTLIIKFLTKKEKRP